MIMSPTQKLGADKSKNLTCLRKQKMVTIWSQEGKRKSINDTY